MKNSPNSHIQRIFGPQMEFSESKLVSNIDPYTIKDALKEIFHIDELTRETLKNILREGAIINNVLRLTDE